MKQFERTESRLRNVIVEEYYMNVGGTVYRYWRFEGQSNWHTNKTALKELPHQLFKPDPTIKTFYEDVENGK